MHHMYLRRVFRICTIFILFEHLISTKLYCVDILLLRLLQLQDF